ARGLEAGGVPRPPRRVQLLLGLLRLPGALAQATFGHAGRAATRLGRGGRDAVGEHGDGRPRHRATEPGLGTRRYRPRGLRSLWNGPRGARLLEVRVAARRPPRV